MTNTGLNSGRPVKFISGRIQICQWCVTILQNTPMDPEEVKAYLIGIVKRHARKPPEEPDENEIKKKAYSHVTNQESLIESIFTSLFSKDKRERNVQEIFMTMYQQAYASYEAELTKYESDIDHEIENNYKKLLSGEYIPRELTSFFAKRDIFSSRWSSPIKDQREHLNRKVRFQIRVCSQNRVYQDLSDPSAVTSISIKQFL